MFCDVIQDNLMDKLMILAVVHSGQRWLVNCLVIPFYVPQYFGHIWDPAYIGHGDSFGPFDEIQGGK